MVNGWLRPKRRGIGPFGPESACQGMAESFRAQFRHEYCVNNKISGAGIARSHFGLADSWVIKNVGTAISAVGH
jgi:hypothetical protein